MNALTTKEQENIRRALRFLKARFRTWRSVAGVLGLYQANAAKLAKLAVEGAATVDLAFRIARIIGVGIDDVLAGRYVPDGMCPHCGGLLETQN
jgi:hypothetical protein